MLVCIPIIVGDTIIAAQGENGLFDLCVLGDSPLRDAKTGTQGRNLGQELKQKPWRSAAYKLSLLGLLCFVFFLTPPSTTCIGMAPPIVD